jgi:hypothetical protein
MPRFTGIVEIHEYILEPYQLVGRRGYEYSNNILPVVVVAVFKAIADSHVHEADCSVMS